jgi:hypothetical protein
MKNKRDARIVATIRNLIAQGWTDEALLVDTAAEVIGGGDHARKVAQSVYDRHYKIFDNAIN